MNIQQIQYILAVGKFRNFGKAADDCFITQSTLSTMIAKFEKEIGITIFDRRTKPVTITNEGIKVIAQLHIIANEIENLNDLSKRLKGQVDVQLKIGALPTIAPYLFPLFLSDFTSHFSDYQFEISELSTGSIIEQLRNRDLDIGIVSTPLNNIDLKEIHLYDEPFHIYDCLDKFRDGESIDKLELERLWILEEGHCLRNQVKKICDIPQRKMINGNLLYKSGSLETLVKFVNKNKGITFLPELAVNDLEKGARKFIKSFNEPVPVRSIGLVVHKHFAKDIVLRQLKEGILNAVNPILVDSKVKKRVVAPF